MAEFVKIALTTEIAEGAGKAIAVDGKSVAIFNVQGKFYAIDNACAHRGGPIGDGMLDGQVATCPWHGWQWDVTTGKSLFNPAVAVKKFSLKVEGNQIFIDLG